MRVIMLDPATASPFHNGKFEGWGTSLCWWANRVGYSPELTRQAVRAFFSDDGLRLDIARYNIGGGDDPAHDHIMRSDSKVPGVWSGFTPDGAVTYDITQDRNQLNVAKAALEANPALQFEGFSNSPPYFMTVSGCTGGGDPADSDNLRPDMYAAFGRYIAGAAKLFREEGIVFRSYSPMNEPDTDYWRAGSEKQEGCHFSPGESQSRAIIETRRALDEAGLRDVLVAGMDETDIDKTVENFAKLSAEAKTTLGRIDTHTYQGSKRAGARDTAVRAGRDLWMSEVDGDWDGLQLAERIIADMNGMQPCAWVIWNVLDRHRDAAFTAPGGSHPEAENRLDPAAPLWGFGLANHDAKTLQLANKYYFWGQFTRYIRPADTIIASSENSLAAYNRRSGDIKVVALNASGEDREFAFDLSAFTEVGGHVEVIRTNNLVGPGSERWKDVPEAAGLEGRRLAVLAKAGTVTTCVLRK